jgi:steroid delta-isomerase-like uncharacterized protein
MIPESVNQTIAGLVRAYNAHDLGQAGAFYAADYEGFDVGQATPLHGPEGIRQVVADYYRAFPDLTFQEEETIVDSNHIVQIWRAWGTHKGILMNIPPTGRQVTVRGISVLTLEGDKIRRGYYMWDVAGLLRSIGLLPEL